MSASKTAPEALGAGGVDRLTPEALKELPKSEDAVFVAFVAPWCEVCAEAADRMLMVAGSLGNEASMKHVDTDLSAAAAEKLGVRSVPALVLYAKGREVARVTGLAGVDDLKAFADRAIADIGTDGEEKKDAEDGSPPADAPKVDGDDEDHKD